MLNFDLKNPSITMKVLCAYFLKDERYVPRAYFAQFLIALKIEFVLSKTKEEMNKPLAISQKKRNCYA